MENSGGYEEQGWCHEHNSESQRFDGHPIDDPRIREENRINRNIVERGLAQAHQAVVLMRRPQMYKENMMNCMPAEIASSARPQGYSENAINRVPPDIYQTQQEYASGRQSTQVNQQRQANEGVSDNSINRDFMGYQTVGVPEEAINMNNLPQKQNIHQEYDRGDITSSGNGQFFASQMQQTNLSNRGSKAMQVDHVEEQCVTRRNTFSGKNPLNLEDTERPVFANNYYAGDNPHQMFREVGQNHNERSDYLNFHHTLQD